ncbi:hypothetical protein ACRRTK_005657 [Alexandromys fortis]
MAFSKLRNMICGFANQRAKPIPRWSWSSGPTPGFSSSCCSNSSSNFKRYPGRVNALPAKASVYQYKEDRLV